MEVLLVLFSLIVSITGFFAILRLFSIDATLKAILEVLTNQNRPELTSESKDILETNPPESMEIEYAIRMKCQTRNYPIAASAEMSVFGLDGKCPKCSTPFKFPKPDQKHLNG